MKKLLLSFSLVLAFATTQAQNLYNYGFSGVTADLTTAGWTRTNQSTVTPPTAASTTLWTVASYTPVVVSATVRQLPFGDSVLAVGANCPAPNGQAGGANSFALVNFTSTSSTLATGATISNWLISPTLTVRNGDVISFYSRLGKVPGSAGNDFPDRLQLLMSTNGDFTVNPTTGPNDVGDFSEVLVDINPTLVTGVYPKVWTQFSYTVSGLDNDTAVKLAFRYFVTNGGTNGANSDIIGIDTFSVDRTLSTDSFFRGNFAATPNPTNDVLNIANTSNIAVNSIQISDMNGRIVKEVKGMTNQINVNELNAGVYFLKITTDQGTGTTKIIKK
jgi:hypothetical protein